MLYFLLFKRRNQSRRAWLYTFVFGGKLSVMAVLLLLVSFLIQPINQAYGASTSTADTVTPAESVAPNETTVDEPPATTEPAVAVPEPESVTAEEVTLEPTPDAEEVVSPNESTATPAKASTTDTALPVREASSSTPAVVAPAPDRTTTTAPTINNTTASGTDTESLQSDSTPVPETLTVEPASTTESNNDTSDTASNDTQSNVDTAQPSDDASAESDTVETPRATSTEIVKELRPLVNDQNYYQFSKQSCVSVGSGTFHCSNSNAIETDDKAAVFARMTDDGDQEIFIRTKQGREEQITDNDVEDTAPQYDPVSGQIVWQRKIDGRYQIILYNVNKGKESQLTFSRSNNMEPSVSDSGVVWQAWDGNDWEIMFYDGSFTDQITNNESQDIGPTVKDGYILWTVPGTDTQEAKVYSIESEETLTVSDHEGGEIVNPRFVLVYDTRFDNGDVVTQSFDPKTGIAQPIAATPAQDPIDIPMPDPIGQIRALISNKSTKGDDVIKTISTSTPGHTGLDLSSGNSSSTASSTLNLIPDNHIPDAAMLASTTTIEDFELTEYDLVITPNGVSTSSSATSTQL
ncbi:hypothetical protein KC887_00065 [Candidatus Kaiserbacteria bacterium]|nr:hypothetical protein [Candidatus Kaiserbacteria bacterium]